YKQICEAAGQILAGITDFGDLERRHTIKLQEYGFRPDYVSVRRTSDLKPAESTDCELVILAAAWLGKARLIDNRIVRVEKDRHPG
ncbi:MAG: pantoate--beta-alanine ligase, partial [Methylococcales bacterium]